MLYTPFKTIHGTLSSLYNRHIFQKAVFPYTHANIRKAMLLFCHCRIIIRSFQKYCFFRNMLLIPLDKSFPLLTKSLIASKSPFIDHTVIRHFSHGNLSAAFLKALCLPAFLMKKRMLHRQPAAFPPKTDRRHMIMRPECRAIIRRTISIIRADFRYGTFPFRLQPKSTLLKTGSLNKAIHTLPCLLFKNPGKIIFGKMAVIRHHLQAQIVFDVQQDIINRLIYCLVCNHCFSILFMFHST